MLATRYSINLTSKKTLSPSPSHLTKSSSPFCILIVFITIIIIPLLTSPNTLSLNPYQLSITVKAL